MSNEEESDFDDAEMALNDDVDVEAFLRNIEQRARKTGRRAAWREIERRMERRLLSEDLGDFYDD